MSRLQTLKSATTIHDVAAILKFKPKALAYLLYRKNPLAKYRSFALSKTAGGVRLIQAPSDDLKSLQRNLSDLLQDCIEELNAANGWKDQIAHGFKRKRSIVSNACRHRGRRWVFNLDLSDFFGSINFGRVRGFFITNSHFSLDPKVATILAQIACFQNSLPQGSPCSPVLSNLIGHMLDIRLVQLAKRNGCTYTRYADDLTFSTNLPDFPPAIATRVGNQPHGWVPGNELIRDVVHSGFTINSAKTRMQYRNSRQDVTGLVVNKKVNIRSEYRRQVRAMVHSLFTTGVFYRKTSVGGLVQQTPGTVPQLHGMLGHIDSVDLYNKELIQKSGVSISAQMHTKESQYRRFLIFEYFYSAQNPVIICEGKTDNVYISEAIKHLAIRYPTLATVSTTNAVSLKVRIFKYPETSTGRILELHGGTGDLKRFILRYSDDIKKFKAPGLTQPVIVIVDNDDGKKDLTGVIRNQTSQQVSWTAPYIHVIANLYVMPTPLRVGATESVIEDFFSTQTLSTVLGRKTFMPRSSSFDANLHYGKAVFAEQVVKKYAKTIDFSGFIPILDSIASVLADHASKQIPQVNP